MHEDLTQCSNTESGLTPAELYRRHSPDLHRLLLGLLRDRADADDALQQVFMKLLDGWALIEPERAKGWLFTVAYREAMTVRRKRNLNANALARLWSRPVWAEGSAIPRAMQHEQAEAVRQALDALPAEQRDVVQRRMYGCQTFAAIADELKVPLATVLTRMRLALTKLRHLVED